MTDSVRKVDSVERKFWIGVVSQQHVQQGVAAGIGQLNHGKRDALARMHSGDWLIYYSPRTAYPDGEPLQAFTAIGEICSDAPYQVAISDDFRPYRHQVRYETCQEVPIRAILDQLTFLPDKQHWGNRFRFGSLSIDKADFQRIAQAMGVLVTT